MSLKFTLSVVGIVLATVSSAQTISTTGSLNQIRWKHQSRVLDNGNVLTFGGSDAIAPGTSVAYNTSELYNSTTGTWSSAGTMNSIRESFASAKLPNGSILAIGGKTSSGINYITYSCELYNPATDTWTYTDSMAFPRFNHAAVVLQDGKVLVAGGYGTTNNAEIYDPATNTWSLTSAMSYTHNDGIAMTRLSDGRVLATGGDGLPSADIAEIYDPNTDTWTSLPAMTMGRDHHQMITLNDGRVLIYGGDVSFSTTTELYDPVANTFTETGDADQDHAWCPGVKLTDGRVLVYGHGDFFSPTDTKVIEIYNPATGTWSSPAYSQVGSSAYQMVVLQSGQILIVAGNIQTGGGAYSTCWLIGGVIGVGIEENEQSLVDFKVYPNPANESIFVDVNTELNGLVLHADIIDLSGNVVKTINHLDSGINAIGVEGLSEGMYLLSLYNGTTHYSSTRIVIK